METSSAFLRLKFPKAPTNPDQAPNLCKHFTLRIPLKKNKTGENLPVCFLPFTFFQISGVFLQPFGHLSDQGNANGAANWDEIHKSNGKTPNSTKARIEGQPSHLFSSEKVIWVLNQKLWENPPNHPILIGFGTMK